MKLTIEKGDLFDVPDYYYFAHCVSSDYAVGAGIAVQFNNKFNVRQMLKNIGSGKYPDCVMTDNVFNLVTKDKYWNKPTYDTLRESLEKMKEMTHDTVNHLAIPMLACGLDRLKWYNVEEIITDVFKDEDINILVRYL